MTDAALRTADEIAANPPPLPDAEASEAWELLRWLADDHFTFLGYREYDLVRQGDEDVLVARAGSGLGVLRSDQNMSTSFASLPAQVRAKAREPQMLVLTKANSRSTVHRPAYLDYVGVKTFDADGHVSGERRFLGLFTSSSYTESVLRIPVLRRKVREVLDASGFATDSHSGKDLLEILETYPRDELFQISVDQLLPTALAVLHLQERRQTRLFLRKDVYGRFMSCLVYLPRDRYTTDVRLEMEQILREVFHGGLRRLHRSRVRSRCWPGCTSSYAWPSTRRCPTSTRSSSSSGSSTRRAPGPTTSSTRSSTSAARRRPAACSRSTARRSPRPTRRTSRRVRPSPTSSSSTCSATSRRR